MSFSDEDLKRLKENVFDRIYPPREVPTVVFQVEGLKALIARLEAAEKVAERLPDYVEGHHDEYCGMRYDPEGPVEGTFKCSCKPDGVLVAEWRKAAGK